MRYKRLICSAAESELILEGAIKNNNRVASLGIGLVEPTINLMKLLYDFSDIEEIIFVGTCGAYIESGLDIFDLVQVEECFLVGNGSVSDTSYMPSKMNTKEEGFSEFFGSSLGKVQCATVLEITKSNELAGQIYTKTNADVEHMELFSVASVSRKMNKKLRALLGVSNNVGENAHEEWNKYHKLVSQKMNDFLIYYLNKN